MTRRLHLATAVVLVLALAPLHAAEAPKPTPPLVTLTALKVEPPSPAPDTLCKLTVTLKNDSERSASRLEFRVEIGGVELPAYKARTFLAVVPPKGTLDLHLFNFWSSETSRPAPKDGKLPVTVTLLAACWVERQVGEGTETWKPLAPVEGLPSSSRLVLSLAPPRH
jgi:hypothetical protein